MPAAAFQAASRLKAGCGRDWPPHNTLTRYWYHGVDEIPATLPFPDTSGLSAGADSASFATCAPCRARGSSSQAAGRADAASRSRRR